MFTAQPFEAKTAPELDTANPLIVGAATAAMTAVTGFVYNGAANDAVVATIRFLKSRPDITGPLFADPSEGVL